MPDLPGTKMEKFENMKKALMQKGRWNPESESALRESLGMVDNPVEKKKKTDNKTATKKTKKRTTGKKLEAKK